MPNETVTPADVAGLVKRMTTTLAEWDNEEDRSDWWNYQRDHAEAATALEALSAENERLRKALREIGNGCDGRVDKDELPCRIARRALEGGE